MKLYRIGYNSEPYITIAPSGNIGIKQGYVEENRLRNYTHARLEYSKKSDSIAIYLQKKKRFKNCYKMCKYDKRRWVIRCGATLKPFLEKRNVVLKKSIRIFPKWDAKRRKIIVEI